MRTVTVARHAMATRFEIVLHGDNDISLRAAAEEALDEIDRLESQLSLYLPSSEISFINARAARESVRVEPRLFQLLQQAARLSQETEGAFDITVTPLLRCWGFLGATGSLPTPEAIAEARMRVGMGFVELKEADSTVRFTREGVMLDLGAIGKGYALERAVELLREAGVVSALAHGGTSTVHAIGCPPDGDTWKVAIKAPATPQFADPKDSPAKPEPERMLSVVPLRDESLSVSAVWGKSFRTAGRVYGHVIDPRIGEPVAGALLAAVVLPSATETDALSTALLVWGMDGQDKLGLLRSGARTLVVATDAGSSGFSVRARGIEVVPVCGATT